VFFENENGNGNGNGNNNNNNNNNNNDSLKNHSNSNQNVNTTLNASIINNYEQLKNDVILETDIYHPYIQKQQQNEKQ